MIFTLTSIATLIVALQNAPDDPTARSAQKLARECADATVKKDFAKVVDLTHPSAVAAGGGREKVIKLVEAEIKKAEQDGVKMLSAQDVLAPAKIYPSKRAHYCVVPVSFKMKIDDKKFHLKTALIGISIDSGKSWKFVDISLGEETVRKLLIDMPKELEFPPKAELIPESDG